MEISKLWNKVKKREVQGFTGGIETILTAFIVIIVGATLFINLMPNIFANLTDSSLWTGTTGVIITSIFALVLAIGFLKLFMKSSGMK